MAITEEKPVKKTKSHAKPTGEKKPKKPKKAEGSLKKGGAKTAKKAKKPAAAKEAKPKKTAKAEKKPGLDIREREPAAKKVEKEPVEKKAKVKKEKKPKERPSRSMVIRELSSAATKIIEKVDAIEVKIGELEGARSELLSGLVDALGGSSFVHPTNGEMSVMNRNDRWFWRIKPAGRWGAK
jgi:hypothetical protein